ncbi:Protein NUCLEAR FUSION DEFECTIVE 4 [Camellia lanceoleosa]|uniref:Protein NUCLEAR FUSION DEFECTIVE 4 n=1 Tax=Camellia lanceoleosa TaxID=1840588 RepID=A0ACC0FWQ8_9ERIC|nr:Protein NUCLEAR FUSION DEFECTIVE 4 [Camellia lanceoleosa]
MRMILLIGLVLELVGFGVQYLHLIGKVSYLSYWHVLLLNVVARTSICWINTYCNLVASRNFKDKTIISLTSSYSALGGKIYTLLVEGITGKRDSQNSRIYLLIRCVVPTVVGLAVALLLSCQKLIQFGEPDIYPAVFLIAIVTEAYALIESIAPPFKYMSPQLRIIILVLVIVLPFAVPPAINASSFTLKKWSSQVMPEVSTMDSSSNSQRVIEICCNEEKGGVIEKEQVEQVQEKNRDSSSDSQSIIEICCNEEKGGIIEKEQIEQVQEKNRDVEVERKLLSRSALIAIIMIPMPASFFLLTSDSSICLYISTSILGACSGAIAAIASSTTSELFGCQNASINQNIVLTSIPVGSLLLGHLAALNYDRERGSNYGECTGFNCQKKTFFIWGIICSMRTILSSVQHLRTQKFYSN